MRLIVTRPPAQAAAWVAELQSLGCDAQALPLIDIAAAGDGAPLQAAWQRLARHEYELAMFVSANAVRQFFAGGPFQPWPVGSRAASTGPGTSAALRLAGVPDAAIVEPAPGADFDSEALWSRVQHEDWAGRRVLIVRGEDGRDWLAQTLRERGAAVDFVAAYRRLAPTPDATGLSLLAQAQADPRGHLWLFSSSQAIAHLRALAPDADWSRALALAPHPRIAAAARALGFGHVAASGPTPAAAAAAARDPSIQSAAP